MRQKLIGTYNLGSESVKVYLCPGRGGRYSTRNHDRLIAAMYVGADEVHWHDVLITLLHEATEFAWMRMGLRYAADIGYAEDQGSYFFAATHQQFSEAGARAAFFVAKSQNDVARAWKQWKKGAK